MQLMVVFNAEHTGGRVYSPGKSLFLRGNSHSLSFMPTDQIFLARVLADRNGGFIHAGGVEMDGKGFLFVGHSGAGKTTMVEMLKDRACILCDDRIIVRRWEDGYRIHGTWSHGDSPLVSSRSAPLRAILFLEKARQNRLTRLHNRREIMGKLLATLIKPLVSADWWDKMLGLTGQIACEVPCYGLEFDKSGRVGDLLDRL
jgi:hypothetical protein